MADEELLLRTKLALETRLKRADQALARKEFELAEAQFAWQRSQDSRSGWRFLLTPTGVILAGAALGLVGTAAGKWADYKTIKRQQETAVVLKASDVPTSLAPEAQDQQRARNLLWFSEAGYIELPDSFVNQLRKASNLAPGQVLPPPIVQSAVAEDTSLSQRRSLSATIFAISEESAPKARAALQALALPDNGPAKELRLRLLQAMRPPTPERLQAIEQALIDAGLHTPNKGGE